MYELNRERADCDNVGKLIDVAQATIEWQSLINVTSTSGRTSQDDRYLNLV